MKIKHANHYTIGEESLTEQAKLVYSFPQGSILGPLIFLIYANDISQKDISQKGIKDIEANLNKHVNCLCDWFVENKQSINSLRRGQNEINSSWHQTELEV